MSILNNSIVPASAGGYEIDNSLRFNDDDSAYLSRTPSSAGNRKTWTWSGWVKRGNITLGGSNHQTIFSSAASNDQIRWRSTDDQLEIIIGGAVYLETSAVQRDTSAWYHILFVVDTTIASPSGTNQRFKLYINGSQVTAFGTETYPALNATFSFNDAVVHNLSRSAFDANRYLDGYLAEVNFIDGQALTPSDFGETGDYGEWKPIEYTGTYGTNGFYLPFSGTTAHNFAAANSNHLEAVSTNKITSWMGGADQGGYVSTLISGDFDISWTIDTTSPQAGDAYRWGVFEASSVGSFNAYVTLPPSNYWVGEYGNASTLNTRNNTDGLWTGSSSLSTSDVVKMTRVGSTIKFYINNSAYHTFTSTSSADMYFYVASGQKDTMVITTKNITFNDVNGASDPTPLVNIASIGGDHSGNSNDFLAKSLDSNSKTLDSPTNNFATWNPLNLQVVAATLSEGNLKAVTPASGNGLTMGTIAASSGSWYWEVLAQSAPSDTVSIGIKDVTDYNFGWLGSQSGDYSYRNNGQKANNNTSVSYGATYTSGDIIGIKLDLTAGTITFYKNNVSQGVAYSGLTSEYVAAMSDLTGGSGTFVVNFGQDSSFAGNKTAQSNTDDNGYGDFYYSPPTGFLALCTANLPEPTVVPSEHFNTVLYTGNATAKSITGVGFQPDFLWNKTRSAHQNHFVYDVIRGVNKELRTNNNTAEGTNDGVTSFDSDGFSVGSSNDCNESGQTYVEWCWKANGSGSSNTDGSITSTVSANTDAGFSIVSYTATGTSSASVGHGLSKAPEMIIQKSRTTTNYWATYVPTINGTGSVKFNGTDAAHIGVWYWNNQNTTNSVFYVNNNHTNISGDDIAYCFHSVEGYSKVGSYTGNGSTDGTFVYTGFRPAYVMVKRTDAAGHDWQLYDVKRDPYNGMNHTLRANTSTPEQVNSSYPFDFTSNGFKLRVTWGDLNTSGGNYIFIAFAENPFKYTNAR